MSDKTQASMPREHNRVSPEGRMLGAQLVRLVEPVIKALEAQGEPDERCNSCAFRAGTVPNGCMQSMADAVKATLEQTPFLCHVDRLADGSHKACSGWLAAIWATGDKPPRQCPWEFSPPDDPENPTDQVEPRG
ncbi:hypothetical protein [Comamonas sp.]|uniref:hypothetical protein n=1 Tax=Comamonas sp. TaxID=34028 RepID=UPI0028981F5C|nr:hypothetical protein [Comamonas sp.]